MTAQAAVSVPYRFFEVAVGRVARLSPGMSRVTFVGADLDDFADNGFDQRIKVVLPLPGLGFSTLPYQDPDWYQAYLALPDEHRNPVRTYTVRAVRRGPGPGRSEVDVDFVLHGDSGPASTWAGRAAPGDELVLLGPHARWDGPPSGLEWRAPSGAIVLVAGDETALPAIASTCERLEEDTLGQVYLEVADDREFLDLRAPAGVTVTWLVRGSGAHGSALVPAVAAAARELVQRHGTGGPSATASGSALEDVDVDRDILWEVPETLVAPLYAWLAGEAGMIRTMRRDLVQAVGLDRRQVAFMGYWREGRAES